MTGTQTKLLSADEALERLLALANPLDEINLLLVDALDHYLAADIQAKLTQPAAALSAMDGYALRFADLPGPLKVHGESAAGKPWGGKLPAKGAVRIFTGAVLPDGVDTVALQEDAHRDGVQVYFPQGGPPYKGAYIRPAGNDFHEGDALAEKGALVSPALIGLAAAAGLGTLPVHRRPNVALVATGDELLAPGTQPSIGQVIDANTPMLAALLKKSGVAVRDFGIIADNRAALQDVLKQAADTADIVVTIGGASVGDHDLVLPALEAIGAQIDFWRIAIRPGKPLMAGTLGKTIMVGLPGNPVSAFVCAWLFVLPLIQKLAGHPAPKPEIVFRTTTTALPANGMRRQFLRATATNSTVTASSGQDSAQLFSLANANALLIREEHAPPCPPSTTVPVMIIK